MKIIWCMVPEIWSMTDRIFCYCGPLFALLPPYQPKNQNFKKLKKRPTDIIILHVYHVWQSQDVWLLRYKAWQTGFFVILDHFLPSLPPSNNPKNQNFEKMKNEPGDIIILHMCTINDNHRMYGLWSVTNRIFCHSGPFFALLPLLITQKLKFWKTEKETSRYYHFTHAYHKWKSYDVWFLRYEA